MSLVGGSSYKWSILDITLSLAFSVNSTLFVLYLKKKHTHTHRISHTKHIMHFIKRNKDNYNFKASPLAGVLRFIFWNVQCMYLSICQMWFVDFVHFGNTSPRSSVPVLGFMAGWNTWDWNTTLWNNIESF